MAQSVTCRCSSTSGRADSKLYAAFHELTTSPLSTLLFPFVVPPASDGWSWPLRSYPEKPPKGAPKPRSSEEGAQGDGPGGRYVMGGADELTDDEGGGGGWWEDEDEELERALDVQDE